MTQLDLMTLIALFFEALQLKMTPKMVVAEEKTGVDNYWCFVGDSDACLLLFYQYSLYGYLDDVGGVHAYENDAADVQQ